VAYRVELPVFSGPLDLLLHLVRQQEVDIRAISIARILEGYLKHLEVLRELDLADIGDFLVMASTLMEIKSRELLPQETVDLEEELDPRDDLIRRLLEYKRYRDLARELESRGERRSLQAPLVLAVPRELQDDDDQDSLDLGEVTMWDLTEAFARLLAEIGGAGELKIEIQKRDVSFYTERLLGLFKQRPELRFEEAFERSEGRFGLIGTLMALLEMMKQGYVRALQEKCFGPIHIAYRGGPEVTAREIMSGLTAEELAAAASAEGNEPMLAPGGVTSAEGDVDEGDFWGEDDLLDEPTVGQPGSNGRSNGHDRNGGGRTKSDEAGAEGAG
jgi:segregation and condensation protein A